MMTEACHGLVDRIVYRFVNKMVQTLLTDVANIHGWSFAYSLKTLQYLDVGG